MSTLLSVSAIVVSFSGTSMLPTLPTRARPRVEKVPFSALREGDVVVYHYKETTVIHRLVELRPDATWVAKGDGNRVVDKTYVSPKNLVGRVVRVENLHNGHVFDAPFEKREAEVFVAEVKDVSAVMYQHGVSNSRTKKEPSHGL